MACRHPRLDLCSILNMELDLPKSTRDSQSWLAQDLVLIAWLNEAFFCKQLIFLWMNCVLGHWDPVALVSLWLLICVKTPNVEQGMRSELSMFQKQSRQGLYVDRNQGSHHPSLCMSLFNKAYISNTCGSRGVNWMNTFIFVFSTASETCCIYTMFMFLKDQINIYEWPFSLWHSNFK